MTATKATKAQLEAELASLKAEFENFKTDVRDRIVQAIEDGDVCREGGNEALDDFGLERLKSEWRGEAYVNVSFAHFLAEADRYDNPDDAYISELTRWLTEVVTAAINGSDVPEHFGKNFTVSISDANVEDFYSY